MEHDYDNNNDKLSQSLDLDDIPSFGNSLNFQETLGIWRFIFRSTTTM